MMPPEWFAIRVKPNFERPASAALRARGLEEFLPVYGRTRTYSSRVRSVEFPLFPGYLFSRFELDHRLPVLTVPGFLYIVSVGRTPTPVNSREIASVRAAVESGLPMEPWPFLKVGDRMLIEKGALRGIEGIVLAARKGCRLIVSVTLLQRSVAVEIARSWVRRLPPARPVPARPQ